jgi:hypothetical protein
LNPILRGLTTNSAETDPHATDRRLVGRTYTIPFDDVWSAVVALAGGGLLGWSMVSANDQTGTISAESTTLMLRFVDDVEIHVGLDENAQTRVDVRSASRKGRGDLGRNRRTIGKLLHRLDKRLGAGPGQILDPTHPPSWSS